MTFNELKLNDVILSAIARKGYNIPSPIQQQAIPHILSGRDIVASAQTGTGKTAAFCLPILQRLSTGSNDHIKALILTPTRELAIQICENLNLYGSGLHLKACAVYGGVSQHHQQIAIRKGVDILVATPGRLLDLMEQRIISLAFVEMLVLDEADRLLDMGFIPDIKRIIRAVPTKRQNILFSATINSGVEELVESFVQNPVRIEIKKKAGNANIRQSVCHVARDKKSQLLKHILTDRSIGNALVFARTKHGADKLASDLNKSGITAESFHGDKTQHERGRSLTNFKLNRTRILVATDVAARGIDITDLTMVINFELPDSAETYTHRIGRTGRAGASGHALSFCDREERGQLRNINRVLAGSLEVMNHPFER